MNKTTITFAFKQIAATVLSAAIIFSVLAGGVRVLAQSAEQNRADVSISAENKTEKNLAAATAVEQQPPVAFSLMLIALVSGWALQKKIFAKTA